MVHKVLVQLASDALCCEVAWDYCLDNNVALPGTFIPHIASISQRMSNSKTNDWRLSHSGSLGYVLAIIGKYIYSNRSAALSETCDGTHSFVIVGYYK